MAITITNPIMLTSFSAKLTIDAPGIPTNQPFSLINRVAPGVGIGDGNVDGVYTISGSVDFGSPVTIDLTMLNYLGTDLTVFWGVGIEIQNTSTGGGTLTIGGGSDAVVVELPALGPGDCVAFCLKSNPLPVNSGATNNLLLTASVGTILFSVAFFARSS